MENGDAYSSIKDQLPQLNCETGRQKTVKEERRGMSIEYLVVLETKWQYSMESTTTTVQMPTVFEIAGLQKTREILIKIKRKRIKLQKNAAADTKTHSNLMSLILSSSTFSLLPGYFLFF